MLNIVKKKKGKIAPTLQQPFLDFANILTFEKVFVFAPTFSPNSIKTVFFPRPLKIPPKWVEIPSIWVKILADTVCHHRSKFHQNQWRLLIDANTI